MTVEYQCLALAASSSDEVCGLIINGDRLYPCANIHPDPGRNFRISDDDWLRAETAGEITAVFHSHPGAKLVLSGADRQAQLATGIDWWLASSGRMKKFRPVPHLLGRHFVHSELDCYSLFRDAYHLCGIDLPDFERANGWWLRGENLYLRNLEDSGFQQVTLQDATPGDVIIRQTIPGGDPCHAMIYLRDNHVLHHDCAGRISHREPMRPAFIKQTHSVWRHTQCLNLDLQGIYDDISARSH